MAEVVEIWKPVPDVENYEISSLGNVRHCERKKILKHKIMNGYPVVYIKNKLLRVHILIAKVFLDDYDEERCADLVVNHKDCDKNNFAISNLEWITRSENTKHAYANGRMRKTVRAVSQYDLDGN